MKETDSALKRRAVCLLFTNTENIRAPGRMEGGGTPELPPRRVPAAARHKKTPYTDSHPYTTLTKTQANPENTPCTNGRTGGIIETAMR
ncbi:hypothetical protein A7X67_07615 [Clostridium sp. W14A]|nr:hypothetical protein A7X67_07615 [Clostridium sp. W14A]